MIHIQERTQLVKTPYCRTKSLNSRMVGNHSVNA
jgi:hypothetical protein